ncbi:unnamed protein product [Colias eurytheme]|nr:unnamed protein product [Colias eurytheme]
MLIWAAFVFLTSAGFSYATDNFTTTSERIVANTKADIGKTSVIEFKNTSNPVLKVKRKTVLIINSDAALRTRYPKKTSSLLYQDYDDDGKLLNSYYMYNLQDVAEFFRVFLDTQICHVTCKNMEK